VEVDLDRRVLVLEGGEEVAWQRLVSTIPLPDLLGRCRPLPERIRDGAGGLAWVDVHVYNVGVGGTAPVDAHWIYVPEPEFPFYRVGIASNVSPAVAPEGHYSLYVETSRRPDEAVDPDALRTEVLQGLGRTGLLPDPERVVVADHLEIRPAYVVHDRHRREALPDLLGFLEERGVLSVGRYGAWTYSSMEDALNHGREAAERLLGRPAPLVET
jgi:protoporphyrinogen oxidase